MLLEDEERQQLAQKLREDLRNVRGGQSQPHQTGRGTQQNSASAGRSIGPAGGAFGRDSEKPSRDTENARGNQRSIEVEPERVRPDSGRSINHGSSAPIGSDQAASSFGQLERVDFDVPLPKRPVGRPRKEQVIEKVADVKKAFFKKKTPLTEKEAEEYKRSLPAIIQSYGEYADKYISWKTQQTDMPDVWGNITDFEAQALANILIRRGVKNAQAAEVVRNMVAGEDYVSVGVMLVPRIIATTEEMKKVPPKPRKKRT